MQKTLAWESSYTNGCQKLDFGIVNKMFKSKKQILVENIYIYISCACAYHVQVHVLMHCRRKDQLITHQVQRKDIIHCSDNISVLHNF